jgi:acyl phosphate:glycerol-3-phosphate acyltransferase
MVTILLSALVGYLLGSIPTGVWVGRLFRGIDIREHGSKSTGATNVFRVLGTRLAIAVLIVDIAKGFFAAFLGSKINLGDTILMPNQLALIAGILAIIGHLFPLFARFHGGKGVATGAGMLLFLAPLELAFALMIFVVTVALTRYVSLGSILAALFFSLSLIFQRYFYHYPLGNEMIGLAIFIMALILFTHRANIGRLLHGVENKLGAKRA